MIPKGLSLLQAPPFSVVAVFFVSGLAFGFLGFSLIAYYLIVGSFNLPVAVHALTLGFAASIMLGALFQMLPVVAGAVIENPRPKAYTTSALLSLGVLSLMLAFHLGDRNIYLIALCLLLIALLPISVLMLYKLLKIKSYTPTSQGMRFALFSFILAIGAGALHLSVSRGLLPMNLPINLFELHVGLMLFGWVGVLIASVAFQVVEMFFITPPYPKYLSKYLPPSAVVFTLLLPLLGDVSKVALALLFTLFAIATLRNLLRRRRKLPDPIVYSWIEGMLFLLLSVAAYLVNHFLAFLVLYGVFALSVITAMLYRIVPFLVWFHLSNQGVVGAPTMYEIVPVKNIWLNFYLHTAASVGVLLSVLELLPAFAVPLIYAASTALMGFNLGRAMLLYRRLYIRV